MFVGVRGWLEVDHQQRGAVERVWRAHPHPLYDGGWAFPIAPFNWSLYAFYGGDIRENEVDWFRGVVTELARLEPVDADLDMPAGFFLLSDERGQSFGWTVRDGQVLEAPAPAELHWFALRP